MNFDTDCSNTLAMVCHCLGIPGDSSGGRIRDAIGELKRNQVSVFRVTDGVKCGRCYSFYSRFDIFWEDGSMILGCPDISVFGIRKE